MHDKTLIDLSKYRLQTAQEFLETSELCIQGKKYKGSINRSYYSIFASMRSIIALDGKDFKKHSGVISYFRKHYIKNGTFDKKYSDIIEDSFEIRNTSDYEDFYIASKEDAVTQYNNAKEFLDVVKKYLEKKLK